MAAGDAQRAWFPEMLEELMFFWYGNQDWDSVIEFCKSMTAFRSRIRLERGIRAPMFSCRFCGGKHPKNLPAISPRSLLYALRKLYVIDDDELKRLDKSWKEFRSKNNLDVKGDKASAKPDGSASPTCQQWLGMREPQRK